MISDSRGSSRDAQAPNDQILEVKGLRVLYQTPGGDVVAVAGLDLQVGQGEILGLVGESGCGKTTAAMGILRLVQSPGRIAAGKVRVAGQEIMGLKREELRRIRWRKMALIPQGAMNSLNPVMRVRQQLDDVMRTHETRPSAKALRDRSKALLKAVNLPEKTLSLYPHELSGGMKQRVCIAMAIALDPPLIIADEPTSALDVVVQRRVAETLLEVKRNFGVSIILIGHDMGLMAQLADRVAVMYAGHVVEIAPVSDLFEGPLHPYAKLLIESVPSVRARKPLKVTEGLTHDLRHSPAGCIFQYRCERCSDRCRAEAPKMIDIRPGRSVACHLAIERREAPS